MPELRTGQGGRAHSAQETTLQTAHRAASLPRLECAVYYETRLGIPPTPLPRASLKEMVAPIREPGASAQSFKTPWGKEAGGRRQQIPAPLRVCRTRKTPAHLQSPPPSPKIPDSPERKIRLPSPVASD